MKGRGLTLPPATLPLQATLVIDVPTATTGQCVDARFPGPAYCAARPSGSAIVCR